MGDAPTGTVTFLFTDFEGSTRRWDAQPKAMQAALARHDTILREAIERHGDHVFKTVGDAFHAAFARAPEALRAAEAEQERTGMYAPGFALDGIAQNTAAVRAALGDESFAAAYAEGRTLSRDDAISLALEPINPASAAKGLGSPGHSVTQDTGAG